jgi:hypothetical protein
LAHTHTAILNLYKPDNDDNLEDSRIGLNVNSNILDNAVIGVAGVLTLAHGGTGLATVADGSILVANAADTLTALTWHSAGTKMLVNTSGVLSMEAVTGTGAPVLENTPTLITPVLGVATGTSVDMGGTTLYASRAITVDTGGVLDVALGSASGDDFTVDTDKLIVEGDTGNVSVGRLHVGGTSDPSDNNLLVDGTTTTDKLIVTTATGYAEMYMYNNATACEIDVANVYHAVLHSFGNNDGTLAPVIDTTHFTYKAGEHYAIASVANYNAPTNTQIICTVTAGHALLAGEPITITGSANYDGTYLVLAAGLSGTEFVVTKTYVATNTGSARRAATLKCLIAGIYRASFNASGVPVNPNDNFKWELNKDNIALDNICARAIWSSATKYEAVAGNGMVSLTVGQHVWLSVKNYSGTGDLTISNANVCLMKVK